MTKEIAGYLVGAGVCVVGLIQGYSSLSPIQKNTKTGTGLETNPAISTPGLTKTPIPFFDGLAMVIASPYVAGRVSGEFGAACEINPDGCKRFFNDSYATATALANPQSAPTPNRPR